MKLYNIAAVAPESHEKISTLTLSNVAQRKRQPIVYFLLENKLFLIVVA